MRKEASLEQWRVLYETATRIKEKKPWEQLWDMDLIAVQNGAPEDTVFFSILGRNGDCYGIAVYEGYEGLNSFLMLAMQEKLNLSIEYVMNAQKNLACYWGDRQELSDKQRKIIKELGYTYRGKNQWLYFLSFLPKYYPYQMDEAEAVRMAEYLKDLETALHCYEEMDSPVDFEKGKMFLLAYGENKETHACMEADLPFTSFSFQNLMLTDEKLLAGLAKAPKCDAILEAEISVIGISVSDKQYDRPASPMLSLLGDARTGIILNFKMTGPQDDALVLLAEMLVNFIDQIGAPREIRVSNVIIHAGLEQICDICGIRLRRVKRLPGLNAFMNGLKKRGLANMD